MAKDDINPAQGRWDHLLREIPTKTIKAEERKETPPPAPMPEDSFASEEEDEVYSVSDINRAIKKQLEGNFSHIWLKGEISNFKAHTSGHHYFSLKDDKAQISAVMFRGFNSRLKFKPESGMEVLVRGKITVYEPRGNYQVFCEAMEPVGAGALQKAFEQLKEKLQQEGLFDADKKQPIPAFPKEVGVVTSPTGAAIQDILNVLGRRSKRVHVTVIPARVQGEGSAQEIVRGIELANKVNQFDVLIVGRGGGSIEDLWCFNEEIVARAIFASKIPVISAVGHEIDFTIADFVADLRAPTPSAAAEVVAKSEEELQEKLKFYSRSLRLVMFQKIKNLQQQVESCKTRLLDPRKYLRDSALRLDDWSQRLINAIQSKIKNLKLETKALRQGLKNPSDIVRSHQQKNRSLYKLLVGQIQSRLQVSKGNFRRATSLLDSLSPLRTVDRGYAILRQEGKLLADVKKAKVGESIEAQLRDGFIEAKITKIKNKEES